MTLIQLTDTTGKQSIYINMDQIYCVYLQITEGRTTTKVGVIGKTDDLSVLETPNEIITKIIEIKKQILGGSFAEYLIAGTDR
jgi:hypothetical protein